MIWREFYDLEQSVKKSWRSMAFFLGTYQNHSPSVAKPRGLVPETSPGLVPRKDWSPSLLLLWTRWVLKLMVIDPKDNKVTIVLCGHALAGYHWQSLLFSWSIGAFQRLKPLDPIYCLANGLPPFKTIANHLATWTRWIFIVCWFMPIYLSSWKW